MDVYVDTPRAQLSLYKILLYLEALVHESTILLLPPSTCIAGTIAILLHDYCAIYDAPRDPPVYAIHHTMLVMAISCKGQSTSESIPAPSLQRVGRSGSNLEPGTMRV